MALPRLLALSHRVLLPSRRIEQLNHGKEPLLALYRARVLAWHGLPPAAVPSRHTILLVQKEGRRGIHNFKEGARPAPDDGPAPPHDGCGATAALRLPLVCSMLLRINTD